MRLNQLFQSTFLESVAQARVSVCHINKAHPPSTHTSSTSTPPSCPAASRFIGCGLFVRSGSVNRVQCLDPVSRVRVLASMRRQGWPPPGPGRRLTGRREGGTTGSRPRDQMQCIMSQTCKETRWCSMQSAVPDWSNDVLLHPPATTCPLHSFSLHHISLGNHAFSPACLASWFGMILLFNLGLKSASLVPVSHMCLRLFFFFLYI